MNKFTVIKGYPKRYRSSWKTCGIAFNELDEVFQVSIQDNITRYESPFVFKSTSLKYKLDDKLTKHNEVYEIPAFDKPDNIFSIIKDGKSREFYISTYKKQHFSYKNNEQKTISTLFAEVNAIYPPNKCGGYGQYDTDMDMTLYKDVVPALMGVNEKVITDVIPYTFINIRNALHDALEMFYINKNNLQIEYDNNKFKLKLQDTGETNEIKVIYVGSDNITHIKKLSEIGDLTSNIIIGVIFPIGKQVEITYKKISSDLAIENNSFNNATDETITLSESTLYIDRHIQNKDDGDTFVPMYNDVIDGKNYRLDNMKRKREDKIKHVRTQVETIIKDIYMATHYKYVNKLHNKEYHIQITAIKYVDTDDTSGNYLNYNGGKLEMSQYVDNLIVNFYCYSISDTTQIYIY